MSSQAEPLSEEILKLLRERDISKEAAVSQIETFVNGIPFTELLRPCTVGDGIENVDNHLEKYVEIFETESETKEITKFVPASGAASRMFKELLALSSSGDEVRRADLTRDNNTDSKTFLTFIDNLSKFAFYDDLKALMAEDNFNLESLLEEATYKKIADYTLAADGLNYANLPKGIIEFHKYNDSVRTAFEEHLVEARVYSKDGDGVCRVHFTVSPEHLEKVRGLIEDKLALYETEGVKFEVSYSVQKPSTDTIAVDMDNNPFLDSDGSIVLRPGGHGALIENLNDLGCDIAFIKNIDNVVPDRLKSETYLYKKAIGGYLLDIQAKVFAYIKELDDGHVSPEQIESVIQFMLDELKINLPDGFEDFSDTHKVEFLLSKLNRPIRVCGVVKNVGEPGGGPFWIRDLKGQVSKQIVESAQVDLGSSEQKSIWESSTHFNPVDLVCSLKDYKGESFNLKDYVDPHMGFISHKSKDGRDLKALELPGLWNGAMADWNTLFVEVPLVTFNPVKGILDLLRVEHQTSV